MLSGRNESVHRHRSNNTVIFDRSRSDSPPGRNQTTDKKSETDQPTTDAVQFKRDPPVPGLRDQLRIPPQSDRHHAGHGQCRPKHLRPGQLPESSRLLSPLELVTDRSLDEIDEYQANRIRSRGIDVSPLRNIEILPTTSATGSPAATCRPTTRVSPITGPERSLVP